MAAIPQGEIMAPGMVSNHAREWVKVLAPWVVSAITLIWAAGVAKGDRDAAGMAASKNTTEINALRNKHNDDMHRIEQKMDRHYEQIMQQLVAIKNGG